MTRAHHSLWILTALTVLAAGVLAQALAAPASTTADILVASSGLLLAGSAILLVRVLRYLVKTPQVVDGQVHHPRGPEVRAPR